MAKEKLSELNKLRAQAKLIGLDVDALKAELIEAVREGIQVKPVDTEAVVNDLEKRLVPQLPRLIQPIIDAQVKANLEAIKGQVAEQLPRRIEGGGDSANPQGPGMLTLIDAVLDPQRVESAIRLLNAWKQPSTEQQIFNQMGMMFKWHSLFARLEKGAANIDEVQKAFEGLAPKK